MNILLITDLHSPKQGELEEIYYLLEESDVVFLLGDVRKREAEEIRRVFSGKLYYIYGNHNNQGEYFFDGNIHGKTVEIDGLVFGGLEGCISYKESDTMHTEEKIKEIIPKCDILLCHDNMGFLPDTKLVIHGHRHKNKIYAIGDTLCISLYKCATLDTKDLSVKLNF